MPRLFAIINGTHTSALRIGKRQLVARRQVQRYIVDLTGAVALRLPGGASGPCRWSVVNSARQIERQGALRTLVMTAARRGGTIVIIAHQVKRHVVGRPAGI